MDMSYIIILNQIALLFQTHTLKTLINNIKISNGNRASIIQNPNHSSIQEKSLTYISTALV